jgi:hypothetical protein
VSEPAWDGTLYIGKHLLRRYPDGRQLITVSGCRDAEELPLAPWLYLAFVKRRSLSALFLILSYYSCESFLTWKRRLLLSPHRHHNYSSLPPSQESTPTVPAKQPQSGLLFDPLRATILFAHDDGDSASQIRKPDGIPDAADRDILVDGRAGVINGWLSLWAQRLRTEHR